MRLRLLFFVIREVFQFEQFERDAWIGINHPLGKSATNVCVIVVGDASLSVSNGNGRSNPLQLASIILFPLQLGDR